MTDEKAIQVRHLTRRFGGFTAVDDVSFEVGKGEIFGFLGSNGAGKSTTIRMLCGLLRPTSGTATATSIYVVSFGDGAVQGLQNGGVDVRDLGELQTAPVYRTRVEWYNGFGIFNGRAAARIWSIADATVTA